MLRIILAALLIAALGFIAGLFLPFWSIALVAFLVALLLPQSPGRGFLSGFLGLFLLWGGLAAWINIANDGLLGTRVAHLFFLGGYSGLLVLVTGFISGLVGGFAAMAGSSLRAPKRAVAR